MKKIISLLGMAAIIITVSCNKDKSDMLSGTDYKNDPALNTGERKVLFVVLDGVRGNTVRSLQPTVLWGMRDSAVYTWAGVSDASGTNGANWAAMLTGVLPAKNGVTGDDLTKANLTDYPVFTKRLKDAGIIQASAAFCASADLSQQLIGNNMDVNKVLPTDDEVTASVVAELGKEETDVIFAEYNDVDEAGKQFGYDESVPEYVAAIRKADEQVGQLLTALRARKNYKKEDWLVIVTSNKGGKWTVPPAEDDGTVFSVPEYNSFTFFYNPRFVAAPIARPEKIRVAYEGKAVRMTGDPKTNGAYNRAELNDAGAFNITTRAMTFECKIKIVKNASGNYNYTYPPFFGKVNARTGNTAGWAFFRNGNSFSFYTADGTTKSELTPAETFPDGNWHALTGVVQPSGTSLNTYFYIDGKLLKTGSIANAKFASMTSTANTIIGPFPEVFTTNWLNAYITDVRIWNTALPEQVIKSWAERTVVNKSHPYYANLIGYWTCTDGSGKQFVDQSPFKRNYNLVGNYTWDEFADPSGYLYPVIPNFDRYVPNPVDIPMVIYNWMKQPVSLDWKLDGKTWPATYRDFPVINQ
ncbi:LamG-like jellyroll fold domain-containing protein [Chitinophaga sp. CB10]|uniref:LamG-like jellyroll fold domain-containing protein n=1 Tax=Chitinophaga sp. CB10 TaxID=1891659 RepID=UPI0025BE576A|nr:LamG-like jellyroll fold domain-containing protein [Chitinophaga sp. CB10]